MLRAVALLRRRQVQPPHQHQLRAHRSEVEERGQDDEGAGLRHGDLRRQVTGIPTAQLHAHAPLPIKSNSPRNDMNRSKFISCTDQIQ